MLDYILLMESKSDNEKHSYQLIVEKLENIRYFDIIRTKRACTKEEFAKKVAKKIMEQGRTLTEAKAYFDMILQMKQIKVTAKYNFYATQTMPLWIANWFDKTRAIQNVNFVMLRGADEEYKIVKNNRVIATDEDFVSLCAKYKIMTNDLVVLKEINKVTLVSKLIGTKLKAKEVFEPSPVANMSYLRTYCGEIKPRYKKDIKDVKLLSELLVYDDYTSNREVTYWVDKRAVTDIYCYYFKREKFKRNIVLI